MSAFPEVVHIREPHYEVVEMPTATIELSDGAQMPKYQTPGSAGFDIAVTIGGCINPGQVVPFPTGLRVKSPKGYYLQIVGRSSLQKRGLMLANNVGIVDADYCGPEDEIKVLLYNFSERIVSVQMGDRVAQGIFAKLTQADLRAGVMEGKNRGGIGSTGR